MFNAARAMLGPIGFLDWNHSYSNVVNIALRVMCFISTFFIMIPALMHTIFVADTFVLRIATAIPLIIGITNTSLYVAMLIQRPQIASMLNKLKLTIKERMECNEQFKPSKIDWSINLHLLLFFVLQVIFQVAAQSTEAHMNDSKKLQAQPCFICSKWPFPCLQYQQWFNRIWRIMRPATQTHHFD